MSGIFGGGGIFDGGEAGFESLQRLGKPADEFGLHEHDAVDPELAPTVQHKTPEELGQFLEKLGAKPTREIIPDRFRRRHPSYFRSL